MKENTQEAIEERVKRAVAAASHTAAERLTLDTTFAELDMTSLDALALIADLEEEFGVEIPNEDAMSLGDVRQAVECVRGLTAGEASGVGQA
ncbi:MAG TPA: phosphopantetheine-binding protein [Pyrinomonadaceae bacterium]